MQSTSCQTLAGWVKSWNLDCWEKYQQPHICRWHHPNGRKQRETKEPLDEGKRGEWKSWLKINIQKTKIMASALITSWQIDGEKVETVTDFIFLSFKITVDSDGSHEIRRWLLLGRKAMTNLGGGGWVAKSCPTLETPWTVAYQAPLSMRFSRQEYWSGLPFSLPRDLPDSGLGTQVSCVAGRFFTNWAKGEALWQT